MRTRFQAAYSLVTVTLPGSNTRGISALALFAAVQVADGILTLVGISRYGPAMEFNPMLSLSITALGPGTALSIMKVGAVALATILHGTRSHLALAILTVFYVFFAVLPWVWVLSL